MARKSKKTGAEGALKSPEVLANLELFYPVLSHSRFRRRVTPEESKEEKPERFYDCAIRPYEGSDINRINVAICDFSAGQRIKDLRILEISATYVVGFRLQHGQATKDADRRVVEQLIEGAAWPMFRGLFMHIASQSAAELPLLPNIPKIRWLTEEEAKKAKT